MSSLLRGSRKVILGLSLAGCTAAAAVMFGLSDENSRKAQAATLFPDAISGQKSFNQARYKWDVNWDKREPEFLIRPLKGQFGKEVPENKENESSYNEKLEKVRAKATRHLILVRHGQYNLTGKSDSEKFLTELGREQARLTGLRLKELALPYTRLVQSTMTRATETATIISKELPSDLKVTSCDFLREGAPIKPDPPVGHWRPESKVSTSSSPITGSNVSAVPVQQFYEDGARIEAAFRRYFHRADPEQQKDSYEILVCHANVIRYFICRALQFPPEAWLRFSLHNCSLTWIAIRPSGRVTVYTVGDIGHVPPPKMTTT